MKSWTVSDELRANPDLAAAVDRLRPVLDEVIGRRFRDEVSAEWALAPDGPGVVLHLADAAWPAGVDAHFRADQLAPDEHTRNRLNRAWAALLRPGTERMIERILDEVGAG